MKNSPKQLIAAAVLAAMGLVAVAQTPPPAPYGAAAGSAPAAQERQAGKYNPARMQERIAKRQERFKQKLQITPAQEPAWNAWTAAMQPPANWKRPDRAEFARLTTPERIDRMRVLRTERAALADKRGEATKIFYSALTPEQKRVFDERRARRGGRGGHHGHHRG